MIIIKGYKFSFFVKGHALRGHLAIVIHTNMAFDKRRQKSGNQLRAVAIFWHLPINQVISILQYSPYLVIPS